MKKLRPKPVASLVLGGLSISMLSRHAQAATYAWDPGNTHGGTSSSPTGSGGAGTWSTSNGNWSSGASNSDIGWPDTTTISTTVAAGNSSTFGGTAGTVTIGSNVSTQTLQLTTPGYTIGTSSDTGTLSIGGGSTATMIDASSLNSGTTIINALNLIIDGNGTSPAIKLGSSPGGTAVLKIQSAITGSSVLNFTIAGGDTVNLANASNSITGNITTLGNATDGVGTLQFASLSDTSGEYLILGFGSSDNGTADYTGGGQMFANRTLEIHGTINTLDADGTGAVVFKNFKTANSLSDLTNKTLTLGGGSASTIINTISGSVADATGTDSSTTAVLKNGTNTWELSGTNNYSGGTIISGGTLVLGSSTALGSSSGALSIGGGTLALNAQTDTVGAASLTGSGVISDSGATSLTVASLAVTGAGNTIASGAVSATGGTTIGGVSSSALTVGGTLAGAVAIGSSGTLTGTGAATGAVSLNSSGTLAAPASGSLTLHSLSISSGSTVGFSGYGLSSSAAPFVDQNALTLPGSSSITLSGISNGLGLGTYELVQYASIAGFSGTTFSGVPTIIGKKLSVTETNGGSGAGYLDLSVQSAGPTISLTSTALYTTLTNSASPGAGLYQGVFSPNSSPANSLNVSGSNGSYKAAVVNNIAAGDSGYATSGNATGGLANASVNVSGFSVGDNEVFLLNLTDNGSEATPGQITTIAYDIEQEYGSITAGAFSPSNYPSMLGVAGQFNLELIFPHSLVPSSPEAFNFNFSGYSDTGQNGGAAVSDIEVADVAVVPEPASFAWIAIGGMGALLRRKRNPDAAAPVPVTR